MGCSADAFDLAGPNVGCDDLTVRSNIVGVLFFTVAVVDGIEQMNSGSFLGIEGAVFLQESETLVARLLAPPGDDEVRMDSECVTEECNILLHGVGQSGHRLLSNRIVDRSGSGKELRETLRTFLVLAVERVGGRIFIVYDRAERRSLGTFVLEVDDFFSDLGAVQGISYFPHSGKARMVLL
jgi:hypothetical protein